MFVSNPSKILLYSGPGALSLCVKQTERKLRSLVHERYQIEKITNLVEITHDPKNIKALCIPGGYAVEMIYKNQNVFSSGDITKILRAHKIVFIGICAGGILGSSNLLYRIDKAAQFYNDSLENTFYEPVGRSPLLNLYPGRSLVPLIQEKYPIATPINFNNGTTSQSVHWQGPGFLVDPDSNVETLSTYENLPQFNLVRNPEQKYERILFKNPSSINKETLKPSIASEILYRPKEGPPVYLTSIHLEMDPRFVASSAFTDELNTQCGQEEAVTYQSILIKQLEKNEENALDEILRDRLQRLEISC